MFIKNRNWLVQMVYILDILIAVFSLWLTYTLCVQYEYFKMTEFKFIPIQQLRPLYITVPIWAFVLKFTGMYSSMRTRSSLQTTWQVIRCAFLTFLILGGFMFMFRIRYESRLFVGLYIGLGTVLMIVVKWSIRAIFIFLIKKGSNKRNILLVGTGPRAQQFFETKVSAHPEWGLNIIGLIDEDTDRVNQDFFGIKCIGSLKDIPNILDHQHVDEVVIVVPRMWLNRIQETITTCELRGVKVSIAGDLFELNLSKPGQGEEMEGFPLLTFVSKIDHDWELFFKRLIDITACLGGLIVLAVPLMIVILFVKISSPGPIFYRQKRVGLHGRLFNMHKFRTMYTDAAERFEKVKHLNEVDGPVFKIKNDPRITPLGRVLRKFSIDELPQLWDVLVGNMSLVGPRPGLASELANFEPWMLRRLTMRPGLTCLWQIMGRNNIDFKTWMELDLRYIDNWSLWLDMTILFKTIPVVVKAQGAS